MAEFIDRMSVVCAIKKYELEKCPSYKVAWVTRLKLEVTGDLLEDIMGIPAANVAEVVRCGECKFYSPVEGDIGDCEREDILYLNVNKSDFCSYGVRKKDKHV